MKRIKLHNNGDATWVIADKITVLCGYSKRGLNSNTLIEGIWLQWDEMPRQILNIVNGFDVETKTNFFSDEEI